MLTLLLIRINPNLTPKIASQDNLFSRNDTGMNLTYSEARTILRQSNEHSTRRSRAEHIRRSSRPFRDESRPRTAFQVLHMSGPRQVQRVRADSPFPPL